MNRPKAKWAALRPLLAAATVALMLEARPAASQNLTQLDVPAAEYTLGHFKYKAPKTDGWRQMSNVTASLSLVYALQPEPEKIDVRFGVGMEAHDIPAGAPVEDAAALAAVSANQMAEARKEDLVARSPIEPVPSIQNLYTYRLMVHSPAQGQPDVYEIYYVMMSPDKKQYLVIQCFAKEDDYANQIYFTEFYGSLASLRYDPNVGSAADPPKPAAAAPAPPAGDASKPAPDAAPAAH
jgi:hypothetical protein